MPSVAHDNAHLTNPADYLTGELAAHADLQMCELVVALAGAGRDLRGALTRMRLAFWCGWIEERGLWSSMDERDAFKLAMRIATGAAPDLDRRVLVAAMQLGRDDPS